MVCNSNDDVFFSRCVFYLGFFFYPRLQWNVLLCLICSYVWNNEIESGKKRFQRMKPEENWFLEKLSWYLSIKASSRCKLVSQRPANDGECWVMQKCTIWKYIKSRMLVCGQVYGYCVQNFLRGVLGRCLKRGKTILSLWFVMNIFKKLRKAKNTFLKKSKISVSTRLVLFYIFLDQVFF